MRAETLFFQAKDIRVLRFNNHDVMTNRQGVLEAIAAVVADTPSPPLPQRQRVLRASATRYAGEGAQTARDGNLAP